MNYSKLTAVQKIDGLARIGRTLQKFTKPELLATSFKDISISYEFATVIKGIPSINVETLEMIEATDFAVTVEVVVYLDTLSSETLVCLVQDSEDRVTNALACRYRKQIENAVQSTDLSPITRTKKSEESGSEEQ